MGPRGVHSHAQMAPGLTGVGQARLVAMSGCRAAIPHSTTAVTQHSYLTTFDAISAEVLPLYLPAWYACKPIMWTLLRMTKI
jgi:hypothetical protein